MAGKSPGSSPASTPAYSGPRWRCSPATTPSCHFRCGALSTAPMTNWTFSFIRPSRIPRPVENLTPSERNHLHQTARLASGGSMTINGVECRFHHLGIPTTEPKPGERFSERFAMYTSDSNCGLMRIQWHRFESHSPLHPLIRTLPHVAFQVSDLDRAIEGCRLLLGPYEPIPDFR